MRQSNAPPCVDPGGESIKYLRLPEENLGLRYGIMLLKKEDFAITKSSHTRVF